MIKDNLKLVIVDDEYLIRELIKNCVNWSELQVDIVGDASNANEALKLLEELRPDILFTDIYMPIKNGLELSKTVKEKYPQIKIVVITGYEEFEYAKKGINIGVSDFLLKPINDDEIKATVLKLKEEINQEKASKSEYKKLKKQLDDNFAFLKENFLNKLVKNQFNMDEINDSLVYYQVNILSNSFQVATIEITNSKAGSSVGEEQKLLMEMEAFNLIISLFNNNQAINVFFNNKHNLVILSNSETIDLTHYSEIIRESVINKIDCSVCIGIGNIVYGIDNISKSYKEANYAVGYKIVAGENQVINYNDINFNVQGKEYVDNNKAGMLSFYLKAGMESQATDLIDAIYYDLGFKDELSVNYIRVVGSTILSIVLNTMLELDINIKDIVGYSTYPYNEIFKISTLPEMKLYFVELVSTLIKKVNSLKVKKVNKVINDIKIYLIENISNSELSLSSVAKEFFVNPSYLSRLFKKETEENFMEYLMKIRMDTAIQLLKTTNMKSYEISEAIGMVDPNYFSICFKKYTTVSVSDYKKSKNSI